MGPHTGPVYPVSVTLSMRQTVKESLESRVGLEPTKDGFADRTLSRSGHRDLLWRYMLRPGLDSRSLLRNITRSPILAGTVISDPIEKRERALVNRSSLLEQREPKAFHTTRLQHLVAKALQRRRSRNKLS